MNDRIASFDGNNIPDGCGSGCTLMTNEGASAVEEALTALETQAANPGTEMTWADGMWLAAYDHCSDCGPTGLTGHTGSDDSSFTDRMSRYGTWQTTAGENIAYGNNDAMEIVMQLFIDDGVSNRGHRDNILSTDYGVTAISNCCHATYSYQTVITYAGGYVNNDNLDSYIDEDSTGVCCTDCETEEEEVTEEVVEEEVDEEEVDEEEEVVEPDFAQNLLAMATCIFSLTLLI
jgi:hypothetical protein